MSGDIKITNIRQEGGAVVADVVLRTWHPAWWARSWRCVVDVIRDTAEERGVHPALFFPLALFIWARILVATVRVGR